MLTTLCIFVFFFIFSAISFCHIYRDFNVEADKLSKLALGDMGGSIHVRSLVMFNILLLGDFD